LSYDAWQKILTEQNRIFDEATRRMGTMFEDAIKQYSDSNAKMIEEAIKQYSDSNAKMIEDAIARQLQMFDESVKQQGQIIDNAFKQFSERYSKIVNVKTKPLNKKRRQNVPKKRRIRKS
jgi:polyhydroxyalkanoate synthesis regulator protein